MPFRHSAQQIKDDAARAADGHCPECGRELKPGDGKFHVVEHWPKFAELDPNTDAARRSRLVMSIDATAKGE